MKKPNFEVDLIDFTRKTKPVKNYDGLIKWIVIFITISFTILAINI